MALQIAITLCCSRLAPQFCLLRMHCGWKHASRIENWINPFWHCEEILRSTSQRTDGFHSWMMVAIDRLYSS